VLLSTLVLLSTIVIYSSWLNIILKGADMEFVKSFFERNKEIIVWRRCLRG